MAPVRFDPHTTRAALITRYPGAAAILPAGPAQATIAELAETAGMPIDSCMEMLARACIATRPDGTQRDWTQEPVIELIDHLQTQHHPYLIAELDRLGWLLRIAGACSPQLTERMRAWITGKLAHMQQEERVLFPLCRALSGVHAQDTQTNHALRQMFASHEQAGVMLLELCEAYAHELQAGLADPVIREVLAGLIEVLDQHIELEDTVLLPAVLFEAEIQHSRRLRQGLQLLSET